jgi:hypothetical protein
MRLTLAALTLVATISLAVAAAVAGDKVDSPYYAPDRVMAGSGSESTLTGVAARSAGEIYQDLRQDNQGQ